MNGAGDEEVFETEASPPAVAGPSLSPLPPDHRPAAAGNAKQATADAPGPGNLVLDLLTGTANLHESLAVLAPSLAQAMVTAAGTGLDCGVVLPRARVVDNGRVITAAGISAGLDAALHVVSRLAGPNVAMETARYMQYDWRRQGVVRRGPQAPAGTRPNRSR